MNVVNFENEVMEDHLAMSNDRHITPESVKILQSSEAPGPSGSSSCSHKDDPSALAIDIKDDELEGAGEEEPLLQTVECRICQEEDIVNNLEVPCACSGSLKVYYLILLLLYLCCFHRSGIVLSLYVHSFFLIVLCNTFPVISMME